MSKPTIALVPGAWHTPAHFEEFLAIFEKAGYPTKALQLPSVGASDPNVHTIETDAAVVREQLLLPLLDAGQNVVLVMHSFGGCVGSVAARGLSKKERGSSGGVVGLVFLAAFLARESLSLLNALGGEFHPWVKIHENGQLEIEKDNAMELFFHDVPTDVAEKAFAGCKPQSKAALSSASSAPAWADEFYNGRRGYVRCTLDRVTTPEIQDLMISKSGVEWNVQNIESGHSPQLSHPQQLVDIIIGMIDSVWTA
ncbi:hypothetical protein FQN57_001480 [Myotisia sp. PD_48]|nr:hypothetical protein FQN57_001480 [Myotisia sp. PD_48]